MGEDSFPSKPLFVFSASTKLKSEASFTVGSGVCATLVGEMRASASAEAGAIVWAGA